LYVATALEGPLFNPVLLNYAKETQFIIIINLLITVIDSLQASRFLSRFGQK
jgi:hypothetical protein